MTDIEEADVVVIGSGMGGLAAARAIGQFGGRRVLVLEQHYTIGGMTHEFSRAGQYHFGTGLHYMSANAGPFLEFMTDGRAQLSPLPVDYGGQQLSPRIARSATTGLRRRPRPLLRRGREYVTTAGRCPHLRGGCPPPTSLHRDADPSRLDRPVEPPAGSPGLGRPPPTAGSAPCGTAWTRCAA
jgi:phytoene dehydrogenase-like protein